MDLRPTGKNLVVRVDSKLNAATGLVSWRFTSLDPATLQQTQTSANFTGVPGSTYVFYSIAEDLVGNIEDTHAVPDATTSIAQGTPHISGSITAKGRDASGALFVDLQLTNTGTGDARGVTLGQGLTRTLSGSGSVTYDAAEASAVPITAGEINAGASVTIRLFFNVPATVTKFSITENGSLEDVKSVIYNFSVGEVVIPVGIGPCNSSRST